MKKIGILFSLLIITNLLSAQITKKHKVYVFFAEECPISIYMTRPLNEVSMAFWKTSEFYAVFPQQKSTFNTALEFKEQYKMDHFEVLMDADQKITRSLQGTVTPEVVVTNMEDEVLYRGRISNAYSAPGKMKHGKRTNELKEIMIQLAAGKTIPQPWNPAVGCFITLKPQ